MFRSDCKVVSHAWLTRLSELDPSRSGEPVLAVPFAHRRNDRVKAKREQAVADEWARIDHLKAQQAEEQGDPLTVCL